jgi:imidazole glycerol-phosphate synthase subunit HisH
MTVKVTLIDTGLCNLDSIRRACEEVGARPKVTRDPREAAEAERIILPGVGNFVAAMGMLSEGGLDDALRQHVLVRQRPFLGICLGMQLLGCVSAEGDSKGLGLIEAPVQKLVPAAGDRVPHMGWNTVTATAPGTLLDGIAPETDFYFVHGFHLAAPPAVTKGLTPYCGRFVSVVEAAPLFGVQFHPEKSSRAGFQVLRNFLAA